MSVADKLFSGVPSPGGPNGVADLAATLKMTPSLAAREAERLLAAGFWPVPLYAAGVEREGRGATSGKEPFGPAWGKNRHTAGSLRAAYADKRVGGVGIALGPGRAPGGGWLVDLEGDGPEAEESRLKLFGGEVVETMGWSSARGRHALHTADVGFLDLMQQAGAVEGKGAAKTGVFKLTELPGLEFRIGGTKPDGEVKQVQSACPPTPGTDGLPRAWGGTSSAAALPEAAYQFMEALAEAKAERAAIQAEGSLFRPEPRPAAAFATPVPGPLGKVDRARLYAAKLDPAVSGRNGHGKAIRAACRVGPGFGLSVDETLAVLEDWNRRCVPPWSPGELLHKVNEAFKINAMPLGFLLDAPPKNGAAAPAVAASARPPGKATTEAVDYSGMSDADLGIVHLKDVRETSIDWLWPYRIAKGEMTIVAGEGGLGKSQLLLSTATAVSRGLEWADKSGRAPVGRTIILAAEDSPETTIKPRLLAMGADVDKVAILKAKVTVQREGKPPAVSFMSLQDLPYWRTVLGRLPDTTLFIIDPLASYLGRGVNDSKNNEIRAILEPFIEEIIRPAGVCLLTNAHLNKSVDLKSPVHRINGSVAYGNLARNVHFVVRDPDDPGHRIFAQAKCNNAAEDLPAIGFKIESRTIPCSGGEIETAIPVFDAETLEGVDLADTMANGKGAGKRGPAPVDTMALAALLVEFMRDKGPMLLGEIAEEAGAKGFLGKPTDDGKWKAFTNLYRAARLVPGLSAPHSGFLIVTSKDEPGLRSANGKARWLLRPLRSEY